LAHVLVGEPVSTSPGHALATVITDGLRLRQYRFVFAAGIVIACAVQHQVVLHEVVPRCTNSRLAARMAADLHELRQTC
jgi:hypothetical protein